MRHLLTSLHLHQLSMERRMPLIPFANGRRACLNAVLGSLLLTGLAAPLMAADIPTASPASKGFSAERLARIRPVIQAEIDAKNMPGAVVVVARKGAIVYSDAIGVKPDAIFRAYSMTKPMTSDRKSVV